MGRETNEHLPWLPGRSEGSSELMNTALQITLITFGGTALILNALMAGVVLVR